MALSKIFTARFYAQNTGFFLLLFYLLFGVVDGAQLLSYHYSLMMGFITNPDFLLIALLAWLLYNVKCTAYVLKTLSARENNFLYSTIGLLEGTRKWRTWCRIHISLYAPVLLYSSIAFVTAFLQHYYVAAIVIFSFTMLMTFLSLWAYDHKVKHPGVLPFFVKWQQWLNRLFHKPLLFFYLYELANNNAKALVITKVASALVLICTFSMMGEAYDERVILLGLIVCMLTHSVLVFNHRRFDDLYLSLLPQLPVPLWKRYLQLCAAYLLLLLPEYILLLIKAGPAHLLLFVVCSVSLLLIWRSLLYFPRLDQDKYFRWVFIISVVTLFLVLAHYYWYAVILLQAPAFCIFYYRYYRYEAPLEQME